MNVKAIVIVLGLLVSTLAHAQPGVPPEDFALLDPVDPSFLEDLYKNPKKLETDFDQAALDKLYSQLQPGPIPEGEFEGKVIFADKGPVTQIAAVARRMGYPLDDIDLIKKFAEHIWKGKHFYPDGYLKNLIPIGLRRETFPAHVFCGFGQLDSRKHSIIIQYEYAKGLPGYDPIIDALTGENAAGIRDEARAIIPGKMYLGRAHLKGMFMLNFILRNPNGKIPPGAPECWGGTQVVTK